MAIKDNIGKMLSNIGKYRYAALILVIGIILMMIPGRADIPQENIPDTKVEGQEESVELRLARLLSHIDGAGRVEVMLSLAQGEQTLYQSDTDTASDGTKHSQKNDTIIVTDKDRVQSGLVIQVNPPLYAGAIVVCEGADDPNVRLAIVDAVSKYTGLGANKISILKMK